MLSVYIAVKIHGKNPVQQQSFYQSRCSLVCPTNRVINKRFIYSFGKSSLNTKLGFKSPLQNMVWIQENSAESGFMKKNSPPENLYLLHTALNTVHQDSMSLSCSGNPCSQNYLWVLGGMGQAP